jgi:flagellin
MSITSPLRNSVPFSIGLNNLRRNELSANKAMQRLATGMRINSAADDPSGVARSQNLRARMGGTQVAMQNVQDTINMLRTAEGGVRDCMDLVHRIRDLCIRGANDATLTTADRASIQQEIDGLKSTIQAVGVNTRFNTKPITSSFSEFSTIDPANITVNHYGGANPPAGPGAAEYDEMAASVLSLIQNSIYKVYGMIGLAPDPNASLTVNFSNIDGNGGTLATGGGGPGAMVMTIDVTDFLDPDGALPLQPTVGDNPAIHGFTREMIIAHEMTHAVLAENGIGGSAWGQEMMASYVSGEGDRRINGNEGFVLGAVAGGLTSNPATSAEYAECFLAAQALTVLHGNGVMHDIALQVGAGNNWDQALLNVIGAEYANSFAVFEAKADAFSALYIANGYDNAVQGSGLGWTSSTPPWGPNHQWQVQIGADSSANMDVATFWLSVGAGDYLVYTDVSTGDRARSSIDTCDRAESMIGTFGQVLGEQENRLQAILNDLQAEYQGLSGTRSAIQDADMAVEITNLAKAQILNQSGTAMLVHASSLPARVSSLINMTL